RGLRSAKRVLSGRSAEGCWRGRSGDRVRDEAPDPGEHGLEVPEEETAYDADKGAEGHVSGDPGPGVDAAVPARADKGPAAPAPAAGRGATGAARAPAVP